MHRPNVLSHPVVHVTTPNAIVDTFIPLTTTTQPPTTTSRPYTVNAPRYSIHILIIGRHRLVFSRIMQPEKTEIARITAHSLIVFRQIDSDECDIISRFLREAYGIPQSFRIRTDKNPAVFIQRGLVPWSKIITRYYSARKYKTWTLIECNA